MRELLVDLRGLLTAKVHAGVLESPDKPDLFSNLFFPPNLCFPLSLIYNVQKLANTAALRHDAIRLRRAELQSRMGCLGEMIPPAKQKVLLNRTGMSCALVDEAAGLLVVMGLHQSTFDSISVGLLESRNHVRSYFEATGQPGRLLDFDELCIFAEAKGLQLILHCEGSRCWTSRPLGSDSGTPTARSAGTGLKTPGPPHLHLAGSYSNSRLRAHPNSVMTLRPGVHFGYSPVHMPAQDARTEWFARLNTDEALQTTVMRELCYILRLPTNTWPVVEGLSTSDAQSLFFATVQDFLPALIHFTDI